MDLKDKVAILTGESRDIGKANALALANKGCNVVINYLKNKEAAKEVVEEIRKRRIRAIMIKADVSLFLRKLKRWWKQQLKNSIGLISL